MGELNQTTMAEEIGASIPENTEHAVSVSLPTWKACVGYEEGQEWVVSKMQTGYPRFFIHKSIEKLSYSVLKLYGRAGESCILFPTHTIANRCWEFMTRRLPGYSPSIIRVLELIPRETSHTNSSSQDAPITSCLGIVFFPKEHFGVAKQFWQHSGEGVSSRRAEFCQRELDEGRLAEPGTVQSSANRRTIGPKRYSRASSEKTTPNRVAPGGLDANLFLEERFGRNLGAAFVGKAKLAVRRRISGTLRSNVGLQDALGLSKEGGREVEGFTENDVFLYPTGMSAIFNAHRSLLAVIGSRKSVCYSFPYIDTLKILEKFGPGCYFYGHGSAEDLDGLEQKLQGGERILGLFCEFPSNPLLKSPDLTQIRRLADQYDFAVVVDETVGNFLNVNVLRFADVVVSSLTKVFSGDSNVMGGSLVLNPTGRYYQNLKKFMDTDYQDTLWAEDALFLERNSRDFVSRIERINHNAETVCELVMKHPKVKQIYYPKYSPSKPFYDACRCPKGGYGGLLSITFHSEKDAVDFYDNLATAKGPSLGTNFTLSSPYTLLAHYGELKWAASFGVEAALVRVSIGLEDTSELSSVFERALKSLEGAP